MVKSHRLRGHWVPQEGNRRFLCATEGERERESIVGEFAGEVEGVTRNSRHENPGSANSPGRRSPASSNQGSRCCCRLLNRAPEVQRASKAIRSASPQNLITFRGADWLKINATFQLYSTQHKPIREAFGSAIHKAIDISSNPSPRSLNLSTSTTDGRIDMLSMARRRWSLKIGKNTERVEPQCEFNNEHMEGEIDRSR